MDLYKDNPEILKSDVANFIDGVSEYEEEDDAESLNEKDCAAVLITQNEETQVKLDALKIIKLNIERGYHLHQQTLISLFTVSPFQDIVGSKAREILKNYIQSNPEEIELIDHPDFITLLCFFIISPSYYLQDIVLDIINNCVSISSLLQETDVFQELIEITFSPDRFSSNIFIGRTRFIIQLYEKELLQVDISLFNILIDFLGLMSDSFLEYYTSKYEEIRQKYDSIIQNQTGSEYENTHNQMLLECDAFFNCGALQASIDLIQTMCVFNAEIYGKIENFIDILSPFSPYLEKRNMTSLCALLTAAFDEGYYYVNIDVIISLSEIFTGNKRLLDIELSHTSVSAFCNLLHRILPGNPELWPNLIENGTADLILELFEKGVSGKQAATIPFIVDMLNVDAIEYTMPVITESLVISRLALALGMEAAEGFRLEALEAILALSDYLKLHGEWNESSVKEQLKESSTTLEEILEEVPDGIIMDRTQKLIEELDL